VPFHPAALVSGQPSAVASPSDEIGNWVRVHGELGGVLV
jgi:hypothetical protein